MDVRNDDSNRCIKIRLEFFRVSQQGMMVSERKIKIHKCIGVNCGKVCNLNIHSWGIRKSHTLSNRECNSTDLPSENRSTCNKELLDKVSEIWDYLIPNQITITAKYLLSALNYLVDWQSKNRLQDSSDWKLDPNLFSQILKVRGSLDRSLRRT